MKLMIAGLLFFSASAFAQQSTDICERFMTCGTFVSPRNEDNPERVQTKITIASTGPMTGTFDYTLIDSNGKETTWPLTAVFDEEGHGILRYKGVHLYATTICKHGMCNYALVPFESEENGIWGNAGLMRFTPTSLEFMMTVGTPVAYRSREMVLTKE